MNLTLQVPHLCTQVLRLRVEPPHSALYLRLVFDHGPVDRGRRHGLTGVFGVLHGTHETHSDGFGFREEVKRLDIIALNGNVTRNDSAASV